MEMGEKPLVQWNETGKRERYSCVDGLETNPCSWTKGQRIKYWLFKVDLSGVQPTMMDKDVENHKEKGSVFIIYILM